MEDLEYMSDRSALSHDIPGVIGSVAGTIPVALGPLGALGQGANLISKGNKLSKMINNLRKTKKAKSLDASIGFGVPQGTGEYAIRKLKGDFGPSSVSFSEDEDSIYP